MEGERDVEMFIAVYIDSEVQSGQTDGVVRWLDNKHFKRRDAEPHIMC